MEQEGYTLGQLLAFPTTRALKRSRTGENSNTTPSLIQLAMEMTFSPIVASMNFAPPWSDSAFTIGLALSSGHSLMETRPLVEARLTNSSPPRPSGDGRAPTNVLSFPAWTPAIQSH